MLHGRGKEDIVDRGSPSETINCSSFSSILIIIDSGSQRYHIEVSFKQQKERYINGKILMKNLFEHLVINNFHMLIYQLQNH